MYSEVKYMFTFFMCTLNIQKFQTLSNKLLDIMQSWNKQNACQNSREDHDYDKTDCSEAV